MKLWKFLVFSFSVNKRLVNDLLKISKPITLKFKPELRSIDSVSNRHCLLGTRLGIRIGITDFKMILNILGVIP